MSRNRRTTQGAAPPAELAFREHATPSDLDAVREIVHATGFFTPDEVDMAVELVEAGIAGGSISDYRFLFCEDNCGTVLGYTCYGAVPCTMGSFDLYWIAVHPRLQGSGIGRELLKRTEEKILGLGGMRIYIETASRDLYRPTQRFYARCGYRREAVLKDYYSPGDSKIIYVKRIG